VTTLFLSFAGELGGAERVLLDVAPRLDGPVVVACPPGPLAAALRAAHVPVLELPVRALEARSGRLRAVARLAGHAAEARRLAREVDAAAVVGWGARSALAVATLLPGRRRVHQHHDVPTSRGLAALLRAAARRADLVLAPSAAVAAHLGPEAEVIHLGVELERFRPAEGAGAGGRAGSAGRGPSARVLFLGAIVGWKRPDLALDAVARVPEARLGVAGAPLGAEGEALAAELRDRAARPDLAGRVEFLGRADAADVLRGADALLHPAAREAFGLAVVEAMATGLPVAAARGGALPEVVGDAGVLFAPGDAAAAAEALRTALRTPGLGAAARRRAEARFDVRATRERYRRALPGPFAPPQAGAGMALVTVIHDSAPELDRLLRSVARHLPAARVIVADSGSSDGGAAVARAAGAEVVDPGGNVGFGRATNAALAGVSEPVTLVVNPDLELIDGSLAALARAAARERAILAPVLLRPGGRREASAHPPPLSPAGLALALGPARALPRPLREAVEPWRATRPRRVGWAVGACLAARTETLRALGPFDERIFLYAEDLDLGLRAARQGVPTVFWPAARVVHHAGHAAARAFGGEPHERRARARREVVRRHHGRAGLGLDDAAQALTHAGRGALKRALGRDAGREAALLAALLSARRTS
jgi:N-acetylglucosaminyl-diphospho-decaprenol L-rhamnosyltransferase